MTPPTPQSSPSQPNKLKARKITPASHVMNLLHNDETSSLFANCGVATSTSSPKKETSSPPQLPLTPGLNMRSEMMLAASETQRGSMRLLLPEESEEVNWLLNVFDPSVTHMSDVL